MKTFQATVSNHSKVNTTWRKSSDQHNCHTITGDTATKRNKTNQVGGVPNIFVIFNHVEIGSDRDYLIVKMSPAGNIVWTTAFREGEDDRDGFPYGVAVDTAGDIIATGFEHDGNTFNWVTVKFTEGSGIKEDFVRAAVRNFELYEPYPNPFVSATKIAYLCTRPADLRIDIFDVDGRLVRNLPDPNMGQGTQSAVWDGCDDAGRRLAAGVYFVHLETPQGCFTKKIVKLK